LLLELFADQDDDDFDNGDKEGGIDMQTSENIRRRYSVSFDRRGYVIIDLIIIIFVKIWNTNVIILLPVL